MGRYRCSGGFTLIELLATIVIIGILTALVFGGFQVARDRIESARCIQNLRSLHVGFDSYVRDNASWPQLEFTQNPAEDGREWREALAKYGCGGDVWLCPTHTRLMDPEDVEALPYRIDYMPTKFSPGVFTPYRWAKQPWLIEIGDFHGKGAHILFPDGSVRTLNDVVNTSRN